jgi:predicted transposase/invertase (TIGR01784 family)
LYSEVKKVYAIGIVYFELGQGKDYVYHGKTEFRSLHNPDEVLQLSKNQVRQFQKESVGDIFPEYYLLRVENFDDVTTTPLSEWMNFLKTSTIRDDTTVAGLQEAKEILTAINMSKKERASYERYIDNMRYQRSLMETQRIEGREEGREKGREEGEEIGIAKGEVKGRTEEKKETALKMLSDGMSIENVCKYTGLSAQQIEQIKEIG